MKRWLAFLYWPAMLGLFFVWFVLLRPGFLDGPMSYVIVSGASMQPTLHNGDLAVVRRQGSYQKGDIVAFRVRDGVVIHRIVGGSLGEGFMMQGDNSDGMDPWRPKPGEILGKVWFSVPRAGRFLAMLRSPLALATLAGGLGVFLVLSADAEEKRPRKGSPGPRKLLSAGRRRWRPPGLTLWARWFEDREGRHP